MDQYGLGDHPNAHRNATLWSGPRVEIEQWFAYRSRVRLSADKNPDVSQRTHLFTSIGDATNHLRNEQWRDGKPFRPLAIAG